MSEMSDQLWTLVREAKCIDAARAERAGSRDYGDVVGEVHASIFAYFSILFDKLPEDDFLATYIPKKLNELHQDIVEQEVMDKLESKEG